MPFPFAPSIPYYYQVREDLREKIVRGEYQDGDRLPGEYELAEAYGVSRPTVRQAVQGLVDAGYLTKEKGRGTFVHGPVVVDDAHVFTVFSDMTIDGMGRFELLGIERRRPSREICAALELAPGVDVDEVQVRYFSRGTPVAVRWFSLPATSDMPPALPQADADPAALMRALGLQDVTAVQSFRAAGCSRADAPLLALRQGGPVMIWEGVLYVARAKAAHVRTVFRGDRISFLIRQG